MIILVPVLVLLACFLGIVGLVFGLRRMLVVGRWTLVLLLASPFILGALMIGNRYQSIQEQHREEALAPAPVCPPGGCFDPTTLGLHPVEPAQSERQSAAERPVEAILGELPLPPDPHVEALQQLLGAQQLTPLN